MTKDKKEKRNKSLDFRRDNRSLTQFKKDIKLNTVKEEFLMNLLTKELKHRGYDNIAFIDNGVNNAGEFIEGATGCKPDYLLFINDDKHLVEIKNSGSPNKCTFKVYHLQQYVKQGAHIILFYGTGFISKDPSKINYRETRWAILTPGDIQKMLDELTPYNDRYFGGKLCVQILKKDFSKFWEEHKIESH